MVENSVNEVLDSDIPQAFSHYSYTWSKRKLLICDLQGVYNSKKNPPEFLFTDPCIHYNSVSGRKHVHGKTDKGYRGIQDFFKTHKCNKLCELLGISIVK
mmetsp:Transcript_12277/g.11107  ORF Transcript_12277/g.11107 Transcript_12277/m.11107 type:complete len:100 (+) Transcript_12277:1881-2180(+)